MANHDLPAASNQHRRRTPSRDRTDTTDVPIYLVPYIMSQTSVTSRNLWNPASPRQRCKKKIAGLKHGNRSRKKILNLLTTRMTIRGGSQMQTLIERACQDLARASSLSKTHRSNYTNTYIKIAAAGALLPASLVSPRPWKKDPIFPVPDSRSICVDLGFVLKRRYPPSSVFWSHSPPLRHRVRRR